MDGGITQSHQVLTMVSESMGEPSEDPGSSNGNGGKPAVKSVYQAPGVRI